MCPDEQFSLDGIDELDTQVKLFQMGVESFSPYASSGKVDMIIRSENGQNVRYADIKVSTGKKVDKEVVWELEIGFFMNNESFIILAVRLPKPNSEIVEKHHFILPSQEFLEITKKYKLKTKDNNWIVTLPYSDLQKLNKKSKAKFSKTLTRSLMKSFDNWDPLLEWRGNR